MKIKRKNKMLILGLSLLGLGTIVGIGCNNFVDKNNNGIGYIQANRQDDNSTTDNSSGDDQNSTPETGDFYFLYDCTNGSTYDYNNNTDYSSIGENDVLVSFHLNIAINITNSVNSQNNQNNLLYITMQPTDLDDTTYSDYFDSKTNYIQPFTNYINKAIGQVFSSSDKQINTPPQPIFDLSISNLSISWEADPDASTDGSGGYFMTLTYDISNNYLNDLNNEKNKNNQLNQTLNDKNKQINGLNNTQIALIVVLLIFVVITLVLVFLMYRNKRRSKE